MPSLTRDSLVHHLQQLTASGGADNRLVISAGDYYVIVHGRPGAPELELEAVSNHYLGGAAQLTPGRLQALTGRGFAERAGKNNLYRAARPEDPAALAALADELLELLARAYGVEAGAEVAYDLQLGDLEPTRNPTLIRAMRTLALRRDMDARRNLYMTLLGASLLVPIDPKSARPDEPLELERLGAFPVIAGFTELDSLRLWQPRGWPYKVMPVAELVPRVVAARVGSLLLNPRGNVGGELYLNELQTLAGALARRTN